jgi:hypothetical protein
MHWQLFVVQLKDSERVPHNQQSENSASALWVFGKFPSPWLSHAVDATP